MRRGPTLSLLLGVCTGAAACSTTPQEVEIVTVEGERIDPEDVMEVEVVVDKCRVPDLKTYFAFDSDEVAQHQNLDELARCLTAGPLKGHRILLVGHTDPVGSDAYNEQLGLSRAKKVASYLMDQGVSEDRIEFRSLGKRLASEDPAEFRHDRRVDINILM